VHPGLEVVHVNILKVKSAKGSSFQVILKWLLRTDENGRKFEKLIQLNQRSLEETYRGSTIKSQSSSPSRLGSHLCPDSGQYQKISNGCTYVQLLLRDVVRVGTEGKGFTSLVLSKDILPAQCKLKPIWIHDFKLFWHIL